MRVDSRNFSGKQPAEQAKDAEDVAAALLLREVEDLLKDGQPRHAIAHIVEVTGVARERAAEFVTELQNGVFARPV